MLAFAWHIVVTLLVCFFRLPCFQQWHCKHTFFICLCFIERSSDMRRFCLRWRVTSQLVTQSTHHSAQRNFLSLCWEILTPRTKRSPFTATTTNYSKCTKYFSAHPNPPPPPPGGLLPCNRLRKLCRWMGSQFHDGIDYNGVTFAIEFPALGRTLSWYEG